MKITYDIKDLPEHKRGGKRSEEVIAIIAFLASQHKNMCISYDDAKECKKRYDTIRNYRSTNKLQEVFDLYRIENSIYVVNSKKAGKQTTKGA